MKALKISATLFAAMLFAGGIAHSANGSTQQRAAPINRVLGKLIDQDGRSIADGRFRNRYVVVNFIFTNCGSTCPMQTSELAKFDRKLPPALRSKVVLLSISVDPSADDPKSLKAFAAPYGADFRRWTFATGRPDHVYETVSEFAALVPGGGPEMHTTEVYLFNPQGEMLQRYRGFPLAADRITKDLKNFLKI